MTGIRKTYKDTLFRKLFGDSSNKSALLSLYNALNGTCYDDPAALTINTIDDAVFLGMKNDISCIIDCYMVLIEHQSTYNPNMPLRGFLYFSKLYDQFIKTNSKNIYGSSLIQIPTPRYFVFYNGGTIVEDKTLMRLSDAFERPDPSGFFEWTAVMININYGHNQELMRSCQLLREYVIFIERVRYYLKKGYDLDPALNAAVNDCIEEDVLKDFLLKNKSEVIDMCITEYNEMETMQLFFEDGIQNGIQIGDKQGFERGDKQGFERGDKQGFERGDKQGFERGKKMSMFDLVNEGMITPEYAAKKLNLSLESFKSQYSQFIQKSR